MSFNPYEYGEKGESWDTYFGTLPHADLRGKESGYLSGDERNVVAAYMGIHNIPVADWIVDNDPENAQAWWHDQLVAAQTWFRKQQDHFAQGQAKRESDAATKKAEELESYQQQMFDLYQRQYQDQQMQIQSLLQQQQQAAEQARLQEEQRQRHEYEAKFMQMDTAKQNLGNKYQLTTDADNYAGETQQYQQYYAALQDQLGDAGYGDAANQFYSGIFNNLGTADYYQNAYQGVLSDIQGMGTENALNQYGTAQNLDAYAQTQRDTYQNQYSQYDQLGKSELDKMYRTYLAYENLGDLDAVEGNDAVSKVATLMGLQKGDSEGTEKYISDYQKQFDTQAQKLALLSKLGTIDSDTVEDYNTDFMQDVSDIRGGLSNYNNLYNQYAQDLYSRYGDVNQVREGIFQNYANQYLGNLQGSASNLSSLLGNVSNDLTDLSSLVESRAATYRSNRAKGDAELRTILAGKKAERTKTKELQNAARKGTGRFKGVLSSLIDDEDERLNLTPSYKTLNRGLLTS